MMRVRGSGTRTSTRAAVAEGRRTPAARVIPAGLAFVALCMPLAANPGDLGPGSPLSAWRTADAMERLQLIDSVADRLRANAASAADVVVPRDVVAGCIDQNHTPDHLAVAGHIIDVTAGMAAALCIKMHVPPLRAAKYRLDAPPADRR